MISPWTKRIIVDDVDRCEYCTVVQKLVPHITCCSIQQLSPTSYEDLLPGIAKDWVNSLARFKASCSSFFHTSATLLSRGSSGLGALKSA